MPDNYTWEMLKGAAGQKLFDEDTSRQLGVLANHADPYLATWARDQLAKRGQPQVAPQTSQPKPSYQNDEQALAAYLQQYDRAPPELANRIAKNYLANPTAGSPYGAMLNKARKVYDVQAQPQAPHAAVVEKLGSTVVGLTNKMNVAPDAAVMLTRQLYAPVLNHPEVHKFTQAVKQKTAALLQAPGSFAQSAGQAVAPQQPGPSAQSMQMLWPDSQKTAAALQVLLGHQPPAAQVQPITRQDADEWDMSGFDNTNDNDSDDGVLSGVADTGAALADIARR